MNLSRVQSVIWDWNGTLLNDMQLCIRSMNRLLSKRNLPLLCRDRYLDVFGFPVKDYYQRLGFDFSREAFEIPAEEFILHYNEGIDQVPLFEDAWETLCFFQQQGIRQYIVSAMEHRALESSVSKRGILPFFSSIHGIANNLAFGKSSIARELIQSQKLEPEYCIFIGDTIHDAEVAAETGVKGILIARGHQHPNRLNQTGNPVLGSLSELQLFLQQA